MLGIHKTRTTPYHPQSDGLVERVNRTIQNVLAAYVSDHQRDWDCYLAQTQLAYNTSQHSSTGYTLHFLLFGREARLPLSVLVDPPAPPQVPETLPEYVVSLRERQVEAYERVREQLGVSHRRQKENYDRSAAATQLQVGAQVWLYTPAVKKGRTAKFSRPWSGPCKVEEVLNEVTYRIARVGYLSAGERRRQIVHRNRLKPYLTPVVGPLPSPAQDLPLPPVLVEDPYSSDSETDQSASESDDEAPPAPQPTRGTGRSRRRPLWHSDYV